MTRGVRPLIAIAEAQRKAAAWGYVVGGLITAPDSPFDFTIHDKGTISLVRVRRMRFSGFTLGNIQRACEQQIQEFRELATPEGISRELWVRGQDRAWHRYRVLSGSIEEIMAFIRLDTSTINPATEEQKPEKAMVPGFE